MFRKHLTRGVKAGVVAGLVFGLFVAVAASPLVNYADDLNHATVEESGHTHEAESACSRKAEGARSHESGSSHADESGGHHDTTVSMAVMEAVSVATGGLWGVVLGGVFFGIAFFFLEPAISGPDTAKSCLMGFTRFVTISGIPWLILPPVAPGAEQSLSTATWLPFYVEIMLARALACLSAGYVYTRLHESRSLGAALVGVAVPFGLLAVLAIVAPKNVVRGTLSPALETGLADPFALGQVLLWLVLTAAYARFRPSSGSESEPGIPTTGRDSAPAAN